MPNPELPAHTHDNLQLAVRAVAFSADSQFIAAGGDARTLTIWESKSGKVVATFPSPGQGAFSHTAVTFLGSSLRLATITDEGRVQLQDFQAKPVVTEIAKSDSGSANVVASPNGKVVAFSNDGQVTLWEGETNKIRQPFKKSTSLPTCLAYSPCGTLIACGTRDGTVTVWDSASGKQTDRLSGTTTHMVNFVEFARDNRHLVTHQSDRVVTVWDRSHGKAIYSFKAELVAIAPTGDLLIAYDFDRFHLIDLVSGTKMRTISVRPNLGLSLAVSPDGKWLALGADRGKVYLWDLTSWKLPRR